MGNATLDLFSAFFFPSVKKSSLIFYFFSFFFLFQLTQGLFVSSRDHAAGCCPEGKCEEIG